jgi:hypothetical protein
VKIQDGVDTVLSTDIDHPVEVLETFGLKHTRVHVICRVSSESELSSCPRRTFEVTVVERNSDAVQTQALEERGVGILEEVLEKLE